MLPLYVTSGEPAGIGPDICLSLADRVDERPIVVLADIHMLKQRAEILNQQIELIEYQGQSDTSAQGQLYVEHVGLNTEVVLGKLNAQNSAYVLEQLRRSADYYAMQGKSVGCCNGTRTKSIINDASISVGTPNTTKIQGVERVVMMLATKTLRVALATTHLALRMCQMPLPAERLHQVIDILIYDLKTKFKIDQPHIWFRV